MYGIADLGAVAASGDQTGFAQHLEVSADGGLPELEHLGEVAGAGFWLGGEATHDAQPDGMADRAQHLAEPVIGHRHG